MPADNPSTLRRRLLWSLAATLSLIFLTSTSTLSNESRPARTFSLGLERAFAPKLALALEVPELAGGANPGADTALARPGFLAEVPGAFRLRPSERPPAIEEYVASLPFGRQIDDAARRHELDVLLLASIVEAESGFQADAVSPKGAMGLMQLMPLHFEEEAEPFDPALNLDLGARYLGSLSERYDGDVELALAAYHAGPGTIARYGGAPPWKETRLYVDRVLTLYREHQENLAESSGSPAATPEVTMAVVAENAANGVLESGSASAL